MSRIRASVPCLGVAVLVCAHAPALGECLTGWWWPPQEIVISPAEPEVGEPVEITVSGIWLDTCAPNASGQRVVESRIGIDVVQQFDTCDRFCGDALTPWSLTEIVEELNAGTYEICATLFDPACQPEPCTPCARIATLVVFCQGDIDGDGDADLGTWPCCWRISG